MRHKALTVLWVAVFVLGSAILSFADMESESYRITTSTLSGAGGGMGSSNYQTDSTLGQSSPLMDPSNPPYSDSYGLYPGFWYTLGFVLECGFDLDGDGDVDGKDLAEVADGWGIGFDDTDLALLVDEFGKGDCPVP